MRKHIDLVDPRHGRVAMGSHTHIMDKSQKWRPSTNVPRHKHAEAYATVVLSGGFQECGSRGRIDAQAGDVLLHGAFDAHLDRIFVVGAETLNLKIPGLGAIAYETGKIYDVDQIAKAAETDPACAVDLLFEMMTPKSNAPHDWPDLLAADLIDDPNRRLDDWAESHGLSSETLSRGFGRVFGVTPAVFRSEVRSRKAFEQIVEGTSVLGKALEVSGFDDPAHLSRAIRSLTGATPRSWLLKAAFKSE
jgi:AraC-like DNA-binding protein